MTTSKCKILKAIALPLLAIIFVASVLLGVFADRIDFFANADSQTPTMPPTTTSTTITF